MMQTISRDSNALGSKRNAAVISAFPEKASKQSKS